MTIPRIPTVVLASASPRRRELLRRLHPDFRVVPSEIEEALEGEGGPGAVAALALRKARAVAAGLAEGIVLGADTVVVIDGEALGKPAGAEQARAMLRRLRGRAHQVITGVAVVDARTRRAASTAVVSEVLMRSYPDDVIEAYVASGEPFDKAGGYAIQEVGAHLVAGWVGSYSNIVGLPLEATRRLLAEFGMAFSPGPTPSRA
ncbi:MAG TPA: Maf family protein [Methylomirabilota bacterium]|jgi:septum formation protein|nr:Maf family protein [Methylomirabilota bacterium]